MSTADSPEVLEFRINRVKRAPRNWTYWVAAFTAVNGVSLEAHQDFMIPAGLTLPYSIPGASSHFIVAAVLAGLALISKKAPVLLYVSAAIYLADTALSAYLSIWLSVVMHFVVMMFVFMALTAARLLEKKRAEALASATANN